MHALWHLRQTCRPARLWIAGGVACAVMAAVAVYLLDAPSTDAAARPASADAGHGKADQSALPGSSGSVSWSTGGSGVADPSGFDKTVRLIRPRERSRQSPEPEDGEPQGDALPQPVDELGLTLPPTGDSPGLPKLELGDLSQWSPVDEQNAGLDSVGALDSPLAAFGGDATIESGLANLITRTIGLQASGSAQGADVQFGFRLNFGADRSDSGAGAGLAGGAGSVNASGVLGTATGLAGGAGVGSLGGLGGGITSTVSGAGKLTGD